MSGSAKCAPSAAHIVAASSSSCSSYVPLSTSPPSPRSRTTHTSSTAGAALSPLPLTSSVLCTSLYLSSRSTSMTLFAIWACSAVGKGNDIWLCDNRGRGPSVRRAAARRQRQKCTAPTLYAAWIAPRRRFPLTASAWRMVDGGAGDDDGEKRGKGRLGAFFQSWW